tara:strand:+ start:691 stop:1320 length:630 start_codon:yes stop_codon:yes gene_type:complete
MKLLLENEDALLNLMKYIQKYNFYNMIEDTTDIKRPLEMLFILSHTCKDFRNIILDKKYNFPKINDLMIFYKREIILPRLKQEFENMNKRRPILEKALTNLPIQLDILENRKKNNIYINYVKKTIHLRNCIYSFHANDYYPNDEHNLNKMKVYFEKYNFNNEDKITNFTSFDIYTKNYCMFMNFKICDNSIVCKCLNKEIQDYLYNKMK